MATLKARTLRDKTDAELEEMVRDSHQELFNLRYQLTTGKQQNTARARAVRKELARIKTVRRARAMAKAGTGP